MTTWDAFYGPNAGYALELYERYLQNPDSVDAGTRAYFDAMRAAEGAEGRVQSAAPARVAALAVPERAEHSVSGNGSRAPAAAPVPAAPSGPVVEVAKIVAAARLARSIREYGHLAADIDPLGEPRPGDPMLEPETHGITDEDLIRLPGSIVFPDAGAEAGSCLDAIHRLCAIYEGPIGYDFDHVEDYEERTWLHRNVESAVFRQPLSTEARRELLQRLTEVEGFERYLHTVFVGQKRFSLEGNDVLVPMLDELIQNTAESGTREVLIGMSHRGRLNVLAHILEKPYAAIFQDFESAAAKETAPEGAPMISEGWTGDVKYHLGGRRTLSDADMVDMMITVADNPSHLEYVDPVVEGFARAAQESRCEPGPPRQDVDRALAVTIHGDAAFPGEGVVAETLNLSHLPGYQTGGTIRIINNNQIGFTTAPEAGRGTMYASDLAKGFEIPVVHVNADDPEAALAVIKLAHAYRQRFRKDFLIDLVGYRRWGHNEGDEPAFTQPLLYARIANHPTVRQLYGERLEADGVITAEQSAEMQRRVRERLQQARVEAAPEHTESPALSEGSQDLAKIQTAVPATKLRAMAGQILSWPEGFTPNPKLERVMMRRRENLDRPGAVDWAFAESLAFASILADGTPIRLSGQDTERGTFSQRHLVLHDFRTDRTYSPLQALPEARASFAVYNSPLSEAATIGYEYGYSVHAPETLVLWEAQFGDFANAGQVLIDQFIAAARAKWRQLPALVLLLPHGYEGGGPEHSSARLERFLQLAAEGNMRITNVTTPAQYFHLLRLQAATLSDDRRPLIEMTPKSLLRHPRAASSLNDLAQGQFQPVLLEPATGERPADVRRLIFCSGKVAIDLAEAAQRQDHSAEVTVARVELLYPFPRREVRETIARYPHLEDVTWVQEEPRNMGAWRYMRPRLSDLLPDGVGLRYIGRPERASTAEGAPRVHAEEQARILTEALAGPQGRE